MMRVLKKFTMIELMIVAMICFIVISVISGAINSKNSSFSYGINGVSETRCINGYMFVVGSSGSTQQMLNENGGGIKCNR